MAGLYPDNETITMYGKEVSFPGVGEDGKYTNGDFDDPLIPPSRLDAITINLIIDNLDSFITSMGLEPNNTGGAQLAALFSVAADANKGIKRDKDGRAKVAEPEADDDIARKSEVDAEAKARKDADSGLSSRITSNDGDMSSLGSRITSNDGDISNLSSRISSNDSDITSLFTDAKGLQEYSSSETFTGKTFLGRGVYRRCIQGTYASSQLTTFIGTGRTVVFLTITSNSAQHGWFMNYGLAYPQARPDGWVIAAVANDFNNRPAVVVCEYTKT